MTTTPFALSSGDFVQDWSDASLVQIGDGSTLPRVSAIQVFATVAGASGTSPSSLTAEGSLVMGSSNAFAAVNASGTQFFANGADAQTSTATAGGWFEFDATLDTLAFQGSGTAAAPNMVISLDATNRQDVVVSFNARDLDTGAPTSPQLVAVQYRTGANAWATVPLANLTVNGAAAASTDVPVSGAGVTLQTLVSAILPASVNGAADLQVRIISRDAAGSDSMTGIDDIRVTSAATGPDLTAPVLTSSAPADDATGVLATANLVLNFSEAVTRGTGLVTFRPDAGPDVVIDISDTANAVFSGATVTVSHPELAATTHYNVLIPGAAIRDGAGNLFVGPQNTAPGLEAGELDFTTGAPPPVSVSVDSVSVAEGNGGTSLLTFTVTRSSTVGDFTIDYATGGGTATAPVDYAAAAGTLSFAAGGSATQTVAVTINGDTTAEATETFNLTLSNLVNGSGSSAVVGTGTGVGTIVNDDLTPIFAIQGSGHRSPLVGQTVGTSGVITAVDSNNRGFWLQDQAGDGNITTSDAVHVYFGTTGTNPSGVAVGAVVNVQGTVTEFTPVANALSQTELDSPIVTFTGATSPLPAPVVIGAIDDPANGLRKAPTVDIGDNPTTGVFNPATQGSDFWETLEGMRITLKDARATSPSGTVFVTPTDPSNTGTTPRGGLVIADTTPERPAADPASHVFDFNPENVQLFGGVNGVTIPSGVNVGDRFGDVTGISLVYTAPEILPTQALTLTAGGLQRETTSVVATPDRVTVASFNVENLSPVGFQFGDGATTTTVAKFTGLANAVRTNLGTPDIIALEEIQDNNGTGGGGGTAANVTLAQLIAAIVKAGGPQYTAIDTPPVDGQDGGAPGGNIRSAYLYRADKVTPTAANNLTTATRTETFDGQTVTATIQTFPTAARIGTGNADFAATRKPVPIQWAPAGYTETQGGSFWTINTHLSSKGGSDPLYGTNLGPNSGPLFADNLDSGAPKREGQGIAINAFAQSVLANPSTTDNRILALGDFNEFQFFPAVKLATGEIVRTSTGSGNTPSTFAAGTKILQDLAETLPVNERYSYSFGGNSQGLDQTLLSPALVATSQFDIVHINSEFSSQLSDHDPSVTSLLLPRSAAIATEGADVIDQAAFTAKFGTSAQASLADADILYGLGGADTISSGAGNDTIYGGDGDDVVSGNQDADIVYGNTGADTIYGGQGDDLVVGGQGDDVLFGNVGDDVLEGGLGNDRIDGGDGRDTATYAAATAGVTVSLALSGSAQATGLGDDTLIGVENVTGSNFADRLTGDLDANILTGGGGLDTLGGGFGSDTLLGGDGDDVLSGNQDGDFLYGDAGADTLYGGQGSDLLVGGAGADTLVGGLGGDVFQFDGGFGQDVITDWATGGGFDFIRFRAGTFASYAEVSANLVQSGSDVLITLDAGNVVKLLNTTTAALTSDHFLFG